MAKIPFPYDMPFSVQDVREEFDRLLDRVWHCGLNTAPLDGQDWAPRMDVFEHPDFIHLRVEVSGVKPEDLELSILEGKITIKGTKPQPEGLADDVQRLRSECRFGSFCRRFELPSQVQEDQMTAVCKNGVLSVHVPKLPEARGKTVEVKSED